MRFQEAGQDMTDFRSSSPPIPTIANKQTTQGENEVYGTIYAGVSPCCRYTKDGHAVPELVDPLCQQNSLRQSSLNCGQTCGDVVNTKNFHFVDK